MRHDSSTGCTYVETARRGPQILGGGSPITTTPHTSRSLAGRFASTHSAAQSRLPRNRETPLWVAYQPIVSWSRGEIVGHEALLRTRAYPDCCPSGVFHAARRLGIAGRLGQRVRESVARTLGHLPGGTPVFVNIEREDLATDALLATGDALAPFAHRIVLEITEAGARTDAADLREHIAPLRAMGYRIAIDDLGAGHNGFAAFAEAHFDIAKIDMSLVRGIAESGTKQRVVRFIYELCASEGVLCVTEGVECEAELEMLVKLGGDVFQGFLFGRPLCVEGQLMEANSRPGSRQPGSRNSA